jgi:CRP-like cAMP-binding protein
MFGELAALDELPRSATVIAVTPSLVMAVSAGDFRTCLNTSPRASLWLAQELASQVRAMTDKVFELSALNVRNRLHCELLRLALITGVHDNTAVIDPSPTHAELANRLGTHREAVTRELRELARREMVRQRKRQLDILNVHQLSRIVQRLSGKSAGIHPAPPKTATPDQLLREMTPVSA